MCKAMEDLRNESLLEGIEIGEKRGVRRGMRKGERKGIAIMVTKILNEGGFSLEKISELSGFSLEEVKELQAELSGSVSGEDE